MMQSIASNSRASSLPPSSIVRHGTHELYQYSDQQNAETCKLSPESKVDEIDPNTKCPTRHPSLFHLAATPSQLNGSAGLCDFTPTVDEDSGYGHTPPNYNLQVVGSNSSIVTTSTPLSFDTSSSGFDSRDELLHVMTEDLVDWFVHMYPQLTKDLEVDNFFDRLTDGVLLGYHAGELHRTLANSCPVARKGVHSHLLNLRVGGLPAILPNRPPNFQTKGLGAMLATSGFVARDNVANFITWCRQLGLPDSVLFESEDLVCRKNVRNVAICLLELARLGGRVGMSVPELVQLEVDIDKEIAAQSNALATHSDGADSTQCVDVHQESSTSSCSSTEHQNPIVDDDQTSEQDLADYHLQDARDSECTSEEFNKTNPTDYRTNRASKLRNQKAKKHVRSTGSAAPDASRNVADEVVNKKREVRMSEMDLRSLDEIIRDMLSQCTCKQPFPMIRVAEGRYLFGAKGTQIFVRILRNHVMVRVGGGWDTLNHFLMKYDECRKAHSVHQQSPMKEIQKVAPTIHHNVQPVQCEPTSRNDVRDLLTGTTERRPHCDDTSQIPSEVILKVVKKHSLPSLYHRGTCEAAATPFPSSRGSVTSTPPNENRFKTTSSSPASCIQSPGDSSTTASNPSANKPDETLAHRNSSTSDSSSLLDKNAEFNISTKPSSTETESGFRVTEINQNREPPDGRQCQPVPESHTDTLSSLPHVKDGNLLKPRKQSVGGTTPRTRGSSTNSAPTRKSSLTPVSTPGVSPKLTNSHLSDQYSAASATGIQELTKYRNVQNKNRSTSSTNKDRQLSSTNVTASSNPLPAGRSSRPENRQTAPSNHRSLIPVLLKSPSQSRLQ